jgi:cysteine-rich repeat protein
VEKLENHTIEEYSDRLIKACRYHGSVAKNSAHTVIFIIENAENMEFVMLNFSPNRIGKSRLICLVLYMSSVAYCGDLPFDTEFRLSNPAVTAGSRFGEAVAIDGTTAIISSPGSGSGNAWVYERGVGSSTGWSFATRLNPSVSVGADSFGSAVAIQGNTVALGAWSAQNWRGVVVVFEQDSEYPEHWRETAILQPRDLSTSDLFGYSVGIDDDIIVVGAPGTNSFAGLVYVYERDSISADDWNEVSTISPNGVQPLSFFGGAISMDDWTIVVGAPWSDAMAGLAYVFERDKKRHWSQVSELQASKPNGFRLFGGSVRIDRDTIIVADQLGGFVYDRPTIAAHWEEVAYLAGPYASENSNESLPIALRDNIAVVGSRNDEDTNETGEVIVYLRDVNDRSAWNPILTLTSTDAEPGDNFGNAVDISGDTLLAGADGEFFAGKAYVFETTECGNGRVEVNEECDDGNVMTGDGCSVNCIVDIDFVCGGDPSICSPCGNGVVEGVERCDDMNTENGDGCTSHCEIESNYTCSESPSVCETMFEEITLVTAEDPSVLSRFGVATAISGDVLVVGAYQADLTCPAGRDCNSGGAFIFERSYVDGKTYWAETAALNPNDLDADDLFGLRVAVDGNTVVIGSKFDDDLCPFDASCNSGAAYVYERGENGMWKLTAKLVATDAIVQAEFGGDVAVREDTILIGALRDQTLDSRTGAAYVFERDSETSEWVQSQKLFGSDAMSGDSFGGTVSLGAKFCVISAVRNNEWTGSAYVFGRNCDGPNAWCEVAKLRASDAFPGDRFGFSAINGETVVIGAQWNSDEGFGTGAAYVYERNMGGLNQWGEVAKLVASDADTLDYFGWSVEILGSRIVVGARGAAHIFQRNERNSETWNEVAKLEPPSNEASGGFGMSLAVGEQDIVVGASTSSVAAQNAGAVIVFSNIVIMGDADDDGDVDLMDYSQFVKCRTMLFGDEAVDCSTFDFDGDFDVDLLDMGAFQRAFTGQGL